MRNELINSRKIICRDVVLGSLIFVMFFNKVIIVLKIFRDNDYQSRILESREILLISRINFQFPRYCSTKKIFNHHLHNSITILLKLGELWTVQRVLEVNFGHEWIKKNHKRGILLFKRVFFHLSQKSRYQDESKISWFKFSSTSWINFVSFIQISFVTLNA